MDKINKILALLAFFIIGCAEKEILPCNLTTINGIARSDSNNKVFNGTCHLFVSNDSVLWKTISYKRGRLSKEIAYFENGGIEYIGNRNREGHIHGDFIKYYRNGNIEIEGQLDNGYRDGEWEVYNESGVLIEKINYSMGEIIDSETY